MMKKKCWSCGGAMARRGVKQIIMVGDRKVEDGSATANVCIKCGEYELTQKQLEHLERRAACVALNDAKNVSGSVLRFARKALGLKQIELAQALGVDEATVCRWETGQRPIQRETQLAVAHLVALYERDTDAFQKLVDEPPPLSANG